MAGDVLFAKRCTVMIGRYRMHDDFALQSPRL